MPGAGARVAVAHAIKRKQKVGGSVDLDDLTKASGHYLSAIVKLNMRLWNDLTDDDVLELFTFMDENGDGHCDGMEFKTLLSSALQPSLTEADLDTLFKSIDLGQDGKMDLNELKLAMFSGNLKEALKRIHQEDARVQAEKDKMKAQGPPVTRDLMAERIAWRVSRDDSFYTLPVTLLFLMVFIMVVTTHLQIKRRFKLQKGMEEWVNGYSGPDYTGPYIGSHVGNHEQFMQWLDFSGLPMALGACATTSSGITACPVAPRSILVGDIKIVKQFADGTSQDEWLLNSPEARAHLGQTGKAIDFQGAAKKRIDVLWKSPNWITEDLTQLQLVMCTYTEAEESFAVSTMYMKIENFGTILADTRTRAVVINPYSDWLLFAVDAVYVIMIVQSGVSEMKQWWIRGFVGYWDHCGIEGAWNLVDIFGIVMGLLNMVQWSLFMMIVHSPQIRDILFDDDGTLALMPNVMSLSLSTIQDLEIAINDGSAAYYGMQLAMGTNVLSVIMKLFKAFGANARLQLVTNTLIKAKEDLFHFGVVFAALFVGFALTGHILFGEDIEEFRSFSLSVNTAFESLLGDFDWYSDGVISSKEMGSGLPYGIVVLWFYSYMIFVVLVMMNMLLAIVMDHYMNLLLFVRSDPDNAPFLWVQCKRMHERAKSQKGFISGEQILHDVVDLGHHPEQEVTHASLKAAFGQMSDAQIGSLMKQLKAEAWKRQNKVEEDENARTLGEIKSSLSDLSDQVRIVTHTCCKISARVDCIEKSTMVPATFSRPDNSQPMSPMMRRKSAQFREMSGDLAFSKADDLPPKPPIVQEDFERVVGDLKGLVAELQEQQRRTNEKQSQYDMAMAYAPMSRRQLPPHSGGICSSVTRQPEHDLLVVPSQQ